MNEKIIYRIEHKSGGSMWYDKNGNFTFRLKEFCPNAYALNFPMEYNEKHRENNKEWYSAVSSLEKMFEWFSLDDIKTLLNNGFYACEIVSTEFQELENEVLFTQSGIISKKVINLIEKMLEIKI